MKHTNRVEEYNSNEIFVGNYSSKILRLYVLDQELRLS
jgi:hypothetical protein